MIKIGVIGTGAIVPFHIDALRASGFQLDTLVFNTNLDRAKMLQETFGFKSLTNNFLDLQSAQLDCFLVATSAFSIETVLNKLWKFELPILVEKPVTINTGFFDKIPETSREKTQVAYNRRFYSSVRTFKEQLNNVSEVGFRINVPENSWNESMSPQKFIENLKINTVHVIDLMFFLFGADLMLNYVQVFETTSTLLSINCHLSNSKYSGTLSITNGVPDTYSVSAFCAGLKLELQPLEMFSSADKMRVVQPTLESPIRRYMPLSESNWEIAKEDLEFKPGFYFQAQAFKSLCESGKLTPESATLTHAAQVIAFCDEISKYIESKLS